MNITPEEILNLQGNYNLSDVKHAFYSLSRQYHPDSSSCSFLSKEEKKNMFIVFESAYKELISKFNFVEIDAPMFAPVEYQDDLYIERNDTLNSIDKFNEEFEKVHMKENKDNPWSIHYETVEPGKTYNLDILRPDEFKTKYYYEYGVNYCSDFTHPGKFTDINHTSDDLSDTILESTDLESLMNSREHVEYSVEINNEELEKQRVIKQREYDRKQVQLYRDFKMLKLN